MLFFKVLVVLFSLSKAVIENPSVKWEQYFDHYFFLSGSEDYRLYWTVLDDGFIEIGLEAETDGWVAFGISSNGEMINSDVVLGWIDGNGDTYLQRRHTTNNRMDGPIFDSNMIDDLIESEFDSNQTVTRLRFVMNMFPCIDDDHENRRHITVGTTRIIYAVNDELPDCNNNNECTPAIHAMNKMGKHSVNFLDGIPKTVEMPDEYYSFDFTMDNYEIPAKHTTYHCKFVEMPQVLNETNHLIRTDAVIQDGNEGFVHHLWVYWCLEFNISYLGFETDCDDFANMDFDGTACKTALGPKLGTWALGQTDLYYPEQTGYPIDGKIYALLEIHYDNPMEVSGVTDSSGLRVYWTPDLREYDSENMIIPTVSQIFVPGDLSEPVTHSYYSAGPCSAVLPEEGVWAFQGQLHAHQIGAKIRMRHIRDNVELPVIMQNDNYDFDYQQHVDIDMLHILPGDEFVCECTYDSNIQNRAYPTYGGESTRDEMCVCGLIYFPSTKYTYGSSKYTESQFSDFWNIAIDNGWWNGTDNFYVNRDNKDLFYYNSTNPEAFEHYLDFINTENVVSVCDNFYNEMITRPEYRDGFVVLNDEDIDYCDDDSKNKDQGLSDLEIIAIGVSVGCVLLICICGIVFYLCKRRGKEKEYSKMDDKKKDYGTAEEGNTVV